MLSGFAVVLSLVVLLRILLSVHKDKPQGVYGKLLSELKPRNRLRKKILQMLM